jgi:hypothetical protein
MDAEFLVEMVVAAAPGLLVAGGALVRLRALERQVDSLPTRVAVLESGHSALADRLTEFRDEVRSELTQQRDELREMGAGIRERIVETIEREFRRERDG